MNWKEVDNTLIKEFEFNNFVDAITWMAKAGYAIEKLNHHPEWTNVYNKVKVKLTTHDAGNKVTDKDWQLAEILDNI